MSDERQTKACPLCGEEILAVAIKCKHCGSDLSKPGLASGVSSSPHQAGEKQDAGKPKHVSHRIVFGALAVPISMIIYWVGVGQTAATPMLVGWLGLWAGLVALFWGHGRVVACVGGLAGSVAGVAIVAVFVHVVGGLFHGDTRAAATTDVTQSGEEQSQVADTPAPPPAVPAVQEPDEASPVGEMQPMGLGADLDPALQRGKCSGIEMKDEIGRGGKSEFPKGSYKKFVCQVRGGLEIGWTMCVSESCGEANIYMLTIMVPRVAQFKNAMPYLKTLSPPAAMREWGKMKSELKKMPLADLRSGDLKLFASPVQAGSKTGQLFMMLTSPGAE